ncbi:MAG: DinB family protein [Chloroflexi bacterium]|nr:DinB family protein [Chloroflexota bacterium]
MTRDEILKTLGEQSAALLATLADIPDEAQTKIPYVDWWTIKDLIGHVAMWQQVAIQFIKDYKVDGTPKMLGIKDDADLDRYNKRGVTLQRDLSLDAVRQEMEITHRDLITAVESLTDADLAKPLPPPWGEGATLERLIAVNSYQHTPEHLEQIAAFKLQAKNLT